MGWAIHNSPGWEALPAFRSMMAEQMLAAQAFSLTGFAIPLAGPLCLALLVLACIHGAGAQNVTLCWGEWRRHNGCNLCWVEQEAPAVITRQLFGQFTCAEVRRGWGWHLRLL